MQFRRQPLIAFFLAALCLAGCSAAAAVTPSRTTLSPTTTVTTASPGPVRTAILTLRHLGWGRHPWPGRSSLTVGSGVSSSAPPPVVSPPVGPFVAPACSAPPFATPGAGLVPGRVTAIGDSVMIDIEPFLQADVRGIRFDAFVGQQWYQGIADAERLRAEGQLGAIVVIELGTNGPITTQLFDQMMRQLRGASRVVFVTNYVPDYWQDPNNAILEAGASEYADVAVANWEPIAAAHPGWFCADHVHLACGGVGPEAMAAVVAKCI
jgi:hypothetical protein